ncbi:DUF3604 domain-containing protein, partial [candidate division WOR-3 bacterium]|nr:DUF3604 domain-containing protein [candidate division WOR-3 bacterium]
VSGGTIQDGLSRGYRLGIIASGDNNNGFPGRYGTGLMACYAKELTRESLWDAFLARRVYGVTGDRIKLKFYINNHFMGEVFKTKKPVKIQAEIIGSQALDRIELIKNNQIIYTYCHNGAWKAPTSGKVRVKVRVEHGWGPIPDYGFKVRDKIWKGVLRTVNARIISVEGCFTQWGQRIETVSEKECFYQLKTSLCAFPTIKDSKQSIVFEIEGPLDGKFNLKVDDISKTLTLEETMKRACCIAMIDNAKKIIEKQFVFKEEDIENSGRSFYYLRVSQLNGQYAWSSPIWVEV